MTQTAPEKNDNTFDLVIIGAGPAGMSAALRAGKSGLKTLLLDEQPELGGQIYRNITTTDSQRVEILGSDYAHGKTMAETLNAYIANGKVTYWNNASVWQVDTDKTVYVLLNGKSTTVHAKAVLIATGAMERPFPVHGWTLPGVMTAGAGQILLKNAALVPSSPVVLAGCGPLLYLIAVQYLKAKVPIRAILDTTPGTDWRLVLRHVRNLLVGWQYVSKGLNLLKAIKNAGIVLHHSVQGLRLEGKEQLEKVVFVSGGKEHVLPTQVCLLHQGVVPNTQISWSLRANHVWDDAQLCWVPVLDEWCQLSIPGIFSAGDGASIGGALVAALQGELAALGIIRQLQPTKAGQVEPNATELRKAIERHLAIRPFLNYQYRPRDEYRIPKDNDVMVCRCEEVTAGEIRAQVKLGCSGPNQTKSFSRCGMGPCQGRMCGLTVTELIAQTSGKTPQEVGYYRVRPPIKALTLGQLAQFEP